ncbi:hypothetical protein [Paraburkholderia kirstenboschensis]|uniref:Chemotaxis protein n=1 Tax=Paraburkholderia kirstenboschensis TaxID=1245436 RepID=A0ABZ0EAX2_9BURK|nr:hypothetical protein [Paraburkholderia kirstenboschensis]WOD14352.1 hypothetical protein RW095_02385 [Paraburkholderia kirstenboschensis]
MAQTIRNERGDSGNRPQSGDAGTADGLTSDEAAQRALDEGDNEKIDRVLDELDVSTTESGKDQTSKPDTEGSTSSSKDLDEQNE